MTPTDTNTPGRCWTQQDLGKPSCQAMGVLDILAMLCKQAVGGSVP
jgi:hypothetical protein